MAKVLTINEVNRDNATLKILTLSCGCKKHICLAKNDPTKKVCQISCDECKDNGAGEPWYVGGFEPCDKHRTAKRSVADKTVVCSEYFV